MEAKSTLEKPESAKANRSCGSMQRMGRRRWFAHLCLYAEDGWAGPFKTIDEAIGATLKDEEWWDIHIHPIYITTGRKLSKAEIEERALQQLRQLEMAPFAHQLSGKLSGGQQQRIAIARALINEPMIIMADEPTGNLDSGNTKLVFDIFSSLAHEKDIAVLAVTHDLDFAKQADRVIEMKDGHIVQAGA